MLLWNIAESKSLNMITFQAVPWRRRKWIRSFRKATASSSPVPSKDDNPARSSGIRMCSDNATVFPAEEKEERQGLRSIGSYRSSPSSSSVETPQQDASNLTLLLSVEAYLQIFSVHVSLTEPNHGTTFASDVFRIVYLCPLSFVTV